MSRAEVSHFWVGHFPDEQAVTDYFAEVWDEDDENREHTPLSEFARDQDEKWYDHDMLEYGYSDQAASTEELVTGYSYSEQWSAQLTRRAAEAGLTDVNMFVFISRDQIQSPQTIQGEGYWLHYLGAIQYHI